VSQIGPKIEKAMTNMVPNHPKMDPPMAKLVPELFQIEGKKVLI